MVTKLYKRDSDGNVRKWTIEIKDNKLALSYGRLLGQYIEEEVVVIPKANRNLQQQLELELASRVNKQRRTGYKTYKEIVEGTSYEYRDIYSETELHNNLVELLPKFNTGINYTLPMLSKRAKLGNVPFSKRQYTGGAKINGERCTIKIIPNPKKDIFVSHEYEPIFVSRYGNLWDIQHIKEYILNNYPQEMLKDFYNLGIELDGEMYVPGLKVNAINSAIKNKKNPNHKKVQFWLFDLVHPELTQLGRFELMNNLFPDIPICTSSVDEHLNNKELFVTIERFSVSCDEEMIYYKDIYIDRGFEGIVIRDNDSSYQYGKRNSAMFKIKEDYESDFLIVDVIPEGEKRAFMCKLILKNDVNDETFLASVNVPIEKSIEMLANKTEYIGKMINVVYRERSGVLNLPFHAKARFLRDDNHG